MCYAIPGRVIELDGERATVDYFGERREALGNLFPVSLGEYVYAQGGVIIEKIPEAKAKEIISLWEERFFELKDIDAAGSSDTAHSGPPSGHADRSSELFYETLRKVESADSAVGLAREELKILLRADHADHIEALSSAANSVRQRLHDNACCVHGIIEFSNHCARSCHYCGINSGAKIKRYRMGTQEIIERARHSRDELGFRAIVLQSGEDDWYTEEILTEIVEGLRELGLLIFLSIGVRPIETYRRLYAAGARAVLLRFETANKETFEALRPGTTLDERVELLRGLKRAGYQIASGFLIGLPGETDDDLIDNILLAEELGIDMYSIGPFIPAEGTPLGEASPVNYKRAIKTIALSRLVDKGSKILVTSALETLSRRGKRMGLMAGANSLMLNVTPPALKELYTLYPGRVESDRGIKGEIEETVALLSEIGRAPSDIGL